MWSAGTASGEEAYSIAMLLAEALGEEAFHNRVKIDLLKKYFDQSAGSYAFRKDLRRGVIFGRHDLVQDAPISRLDLPVCRNALMYFNAETQAKILAHFHFALDEDGYLFLGGAILLMEES